MKKNSLALFFCAALLLSPAICPAQTEGEEQPQNTEYDTVPDAASEVEIGYRPASIIPMPPHLPPYLPNGAPNLDYDWLEDGGARLYWNYIIIPQQLRMDGASWRDPALMPELLPPKKPTRVISRSRSYRQSAAAKPAPRTSQTASRRPSTAIPLPVAPVIPPLTADQISPSAVIAPMVEVPRLQ